MEPRRRASPVSARREDGWIALYRDLLGDAFDALPPVLRAMHEPGDGLVAEGTATVRRGDTLAARLVARLLGMPRAGDAVPLVVAFSALPGREVWRRDFDGRVIETVQRIVAGGGATLLEERLGLVSWRFAVRAEADSLEFALRGASLLGIPLPAVLRPTIRARESVRDGRFHFDAEVRLPLLGRLIEYSGDLQPREGGG